MHTKAYEVMEELRKKDFSMTTKEFFKTTIFKVLDKYHIKEKLNAEEYYKLLKMLIDECALQDMKNMGIDFFEDDDWKDK